MKSGRKQKKTLKQELSYSLIRSHGQTAYNPEDYGQSPEWQMRAGTQDEVHEVTIPTTAVARGRQFVSIMVLAIIWGQIATGQEYSLNPIEIDDLLVNDVALNAFRKTLPKSHVSGDRGITEFTEKLKREGRNLELVKCLENLLDSGIEGELGMERNSVPLALVGAYCDTKQFAKAIEFVWHRKRPNFKYQNWLYNDIRLEQIFEIEILVVSLLLNGQFDHAQEQMNELEKLFKKTRSEGPNDVPEDLRGDPKMFEMAKSTFDGQLATYELLHQANHAHLALFRGDRQRALELCTRRINEARKQGLPTEFLPETDIGRFCRTPGMSADAAVGEWFARRKQNTLGVDADDREYDNNFARVMTFFPWQQLSSGTDKASLQLAYSLLGNQKGRYGLQRKLDHHLMMQADDDPKELARNRDEQYRLQKSIESRDDFKPSLGEIFTTYSAFRPFDVLNIAGLSSSLATFKPSTTEPLARYRLDGLEAASNKMLDSLPRPPSESGEKPVLKWADCGEWIRHLSSDATAIDLLRFPVFDFESLDKGIFQWGPDRYGAFIVSRDGGIQWRELGNADEIDRAITDALADLRKPADAFSSAVKHLSELLLHPLQEMIAETHTAELIISPDSQLWLVPWAALATSNERFLVEDYRLRYITGARCLLPSNDAKGAAPINPPVLIGDPNFSLTPKDLVPLEKEVLGKVQESLIRIPMEEHLSVLPVVQQLPFTRVEAGYVSKLVREYTGKEPQLLLGNAAFEARIATIEHPQVLVFSTHGFFFPDIGSESTLTVPAPTKQPANVRDTSIGAVVARSVDPAKQFLTKDPLHRCGLLLAGCNHSHDWNMLRAAEGILTGKEISLLDLRGTELVVLSACDTGIGEIRNGQGVAGLRQAFQIAGAENVVATLWQVDDLETARLIVRFFQFLVKGQSYPEALHNAQLDRIKDLRNRFGFADPYFWASFTLTN